MSDGDRDTDSPEVSDRVIRTGNRQRGAWASPGAKVVLFLFLGSWIAVVAIHMSRGFNPLERNALVAIVCGAAVADGLRRTATESWHAVHAAVRWIYVAILGISMFFGVKAL